MNLLLSWHGVGVALAAALFLAGCQPKEVPPTMFNATFQAADDINPASDGRASPLLLRVYTLRTLGGFEGADFFAIYENDATLLAADMTSPREDINILPGQTRSLNRKLSDDTRFVVLLAAYRDVDNAAWRAVVETPANQTTSAVINLDRLAISAKLVP